MRSSVLSPQSSVLSPRLPSRRWLLQWLTVCVVSVALGVTALVAADLPLKTAPLLLVAALCPFIAIITGDVRRFLLGLIMLDIPMQVDTHFNYRPEVGSLGAIGGWSVSVTTVCLALLYLFWLVERLTNRTMDDRRWTIDDGRWTMDNVPSSKQRPLFRSSLPLGIYLVVAVISVLVAGDVQLSLFELFLFAQLFMLFIYIVHWANTQEDVVFLVAMLLGGLLLESLIMVGRINIPLLSTRIDAGKGYGGPAFRLGGTLGSPNTAAGYLSLLLAPALSVLLTKLGVFYKALALMAFAGGAAALILTFSRGGWIAAVISITLLCVFAWLRGWLAPAIPVAGLFIVLCILMLFQDSILGRFSASDRGSAYSRIPLMEIAFNMIKDYPLLGVGANNYAAILKHYTTPEFTGAFIYTVHNQYLVIWSETGPLGLLAYVGFLLNTLRRGWTGWRLHDRVLAPLALGLTVGMVGQMTHMFADIFNGRPQMQLLWTVAAIVAAIYNLAPRSADDGRRTMDDGR